MENQKLSEDNIIETVVKLMQQIDKIKDSNGEKKKLYVMSGTKLLIGDEMYQRYEYFISIFIDFTIKISKGDIKLDLNKIKQKYCCY
jgi:hypothetical protein